MKKLFSALLAIMIMAVSVVSINAVTVIQSGGYYFAEQSDGSYMITGCDGLLDVRIPGSFLSSPVSEIKARAFAKNTTITSLSFDSAYTLKVINMYAFSGCTGIKSVIVPETVTNVGISIFKGCTGLTNAEFYGNRFTVPNETFSGCTNLETAVISDNVEEIGAFAFADCTALKYLELPKTVKLIGNNAFVNDSNLTLGVWYNSYAYQYAKENNINYTLLDGVKLGDVDGDGDITITDATAVQRYLAELDVLDDIHLYAADANGDGDVDISDATAIQMAVASIPTGYPIGEVITK